MRKHCRQHPGHDIGKIVFRDFVPYVEEETAALGQDAARLPVALPFVRKEHRAELAGHGVEALIRKGQRQRVGLLPFYSAVTRLAGISHGRASAD